MTKKIKVFLVGLLAMATAVVGVGVGGDTDTADAGGYWRGNAYISWEYRSHSVHAYSTRTPTYGHIHHPSWYGFCQTVYITRDFGSYVDVERAGNWRSC